MNNSKQIADFILTHGITRCPTACVTRTIARPSEADRIALAAYGERQEAARTERLARFMGRAA